MEATFKGIDDFNRPIYKVENKPTIYVGSTDKLFSFDATKSEVDAYFAENMHQLEYFGTQFNCEPTGGIINNLKII